MYCPNCGTKGETDKNFCRSCGLRLDTVAVVVAGQLPSAENAALAKRRKMVKKLGLGSLSIAGSIGLMTLLFAAGVYKLVLLGPAVLFWSTAIALTFFLLVGMALYCYSTFFMWFDGGEDRPTHLDEIPSGITTGKLLEDRPFEPVPSVTENTTDLLKIGQTRHRN